MKILNRKNIKLYLKNRKRFNSAYDGDKKTRTSSDAVSMKIHHVTDVTAKQLMRTSVLLNW